MQMRRVVTVSIVLSAVAAGFGSGAASAAPPEVTLTPPRAPQDTPYTISVACPTEPSVSVNDEYDDGFGALDTMEGPPGTWTSERDASDVDALYYVTCEGESAEARFDVEAPKMFFGRYFGPFGTEDPPTEVVGKDCPPGTTATVSLGYRAGVYVIDDVAIDEQGDWEIDLPADAITYGVSVDASCGDVAYDSILFVPELIPPSASTPSSTTQRPQAIPSPGEAAPAQAVPGQADFTG